MLAPLGLQALTETTFVHAVRYTRMPFRCHVCIIVATLLEHTDEQTYTFPTHKVDAPSLAIIMPILQRGLRDRNTENKKQSAVIVGSICSLIATPAFVTPYLPR